MRGVDYEQGTISIEHFSFSEYPKEEQILNATQKVREIAETTVKTVDTAKQMASLGQEKKLSNDITKTIKPIDLPSSVLPFEHLVCMFVFLRFIWIYLCTYDSTRFNSRTAGWLLSKAL